MKRYKKIPLIIDTDPGHDDAIAILILGLSQSVDILGITTVAGNGTIQEVTDNARYICSLINLNVPIYSGAEKPLRRQLIPAVVHGSGALGGAPVKRGGVCTGDAVEQIISLVRKNPNEVTVLLLGPQTNLAKAFEKDPELPKLIKRVVMMGGAITAPGNKNRVAEFNMFVDPEAAALIFAAPVPKILIPLDVCNTVVLSLKNFSLLEKSKLYEAIYKMMKSFLCGIRKNENFDGILIYDALAAYYVLNPDAFETVRMDVRVETRGVLTRGMTVADRRNWGEKDANIDVAFTIDKKQFITDLISLLRKA